MNGEAFDQRTPAFNVEADAALRAGTLDGVGE
jgi:hypothetical protein